MPTSLPSPQPTAVRQCCPRLSFRKQLKSVRLQSAPPCGWAVGYNRDQPVCQASYSTRVQRQKSVQEYRQTGTCPGCRGVPKCWELAGNGQWSYWSTKQLFWIRGGRLTSLDASFMRCFGFFKHVWCFPWCFRFQKGHSESELNKQVRAKQASFLSGPKMSKMVGIYNIHAFVI